MVFFVLSGFLIGKSVCNNISKNQEFNIAQYARDRALRLYPPLVIALLLMILLSAIAPLLFPSGTQQFIQIPGATFARTGFTVETQQLLGSLFFLNEFKTSTPSANGPLWSLSLEAWYYVIAAAIFLWPSRRAASVVLLVVVILVTWKNKMFIMLAPIWFSGFWLAFLHQRKPEMNNRVFGWLFLALTIVVIVIAALVLFGGPQGEGGLFDRMNHFRLASGLWFACFMALIMGGGASFPKFFHGQAGYSYTLYVIHFPIMLFVLGVTQSVIYGSVLLSLLTAVVVIIISIVSAKTIANYAENKNLIHSMAAKTKRMAS